MQIAQSLYLQEAHANLDNLNCHNNMKQTCKSLKIAENNMSKFKFQSKTFYLKLKHFYQHLEEGNKQIAAYMSVYKRY